MDGQGPASKREFRQVLDELIVQAYRNDISIANGGYVFRHDSVDIPDIELMVYRLTNSSDDAD